MTAWEFIDTLARSQLLTNTVVNKLRQQVQQSSQTITAEGLAKLLVKKGQLTPEQATRLLETPIPPPKPLNEQEELGLAPDEPDQFLITDDDLVDIEEDGVEPLEVPPPPLGDATLDRMNEPTSDVAWPSDHQLVAPELDVDAVDSELDEAALASEVSGVVVSRRRGLARWLAALRPPRAARKYSANRWDSPLMLVGGGTLLVLLAVGVALYFYLSRGTGDDAFNAANESYRQAAYSQAITQFQQFADDYSDHPKASAARVRMGLARIWNQVEEERWQQSLDEVRAQLPRIVDEPAFNDARPELASLLPEIAEGFADQALAAEDVVSCEQYLRLANQTMEQVNNSAYLPTSVRKDQQPRIERVLANLESAQRRIDRDRQLEAVVVEIKAAAAQREIAQAYQLRKDLLKAYPSLESDRRLDAVVLEVTSAERAAVEAWQEVPQATSEQPALTSQYRITLTRRRGDSVPELAGQVIFVAAEGAIYGLNAEDGSVLWRQYVGFAADVTPVDLADVGLSDVVVVDRPSRELRRLDGRTGQIVWRLPCPGLPTPPQLQAGQLWTACGDPERGWLLAVDPATGNVVHGAELPVPVNVSPVIDVERQRVIQPAAYASIYVFDMQQLSCLSVSYLGHADGTIAVPPVIVGGAVVVAENPGLDFGLLHALSYAADPPGALEATGEPFRLDGQVVVPIHVSGRRALLATDRGKLEVLNLDLKQKPSPWQVAAEASATVPAGTASYLLLDQGRLWVGDAQLTRYELQTSRGQLVRKWLTHKGDRFVTPLQLRGSTLIHARRRRGNLGVTVAAEYVGDERNGRQEGTTLWEVDLGVPPAGNPIVDRSAQEIDVVNRNGVLFAIGKDAIRAGTLDTPRAEVLDPSFTPLVDGISLDDRQYAFFPSSSEARALILQLDDHESPFRTLTLELGGQRAATLPVAFRHQLLVPTTSGGVHLLDPQTGKPVMSPFQAPMTSGSEMSWQRPTADPGGDEVWLSDGRVQVYQLAISTAPQPHLAALKQRQVDAPLAAPIVVLGSTVCGLVRGNNQDILRRWAVEDWQPQDSTELPGHVVWGPHALGDYLLLMTDGGQLVGVDGQTQRFSVDTISSPAIGPPQHYEDGFVIATIEGSLWHLDASSGRVRSTVDVAEALGTGPVPFAGNRFIVCGTDGTLHIVPLTDE